ncbi:hypothetical protein ZIOFF_047558 [Zingiber officinale]|uniref:Uncharacterized protein n=1 Tax=Zingiber officinale TaxID=94328 RepID=A0A8J5FPP8_ZINOF|nr:hypothetical protein ZIOFF_047558 [Zingiber officinale]
MTPNGAIRFVALLLATKARSHRSSSAILHRSLQRRLSHFSVAPVLSYLGKGFRTLLPVLTPIPPPRRYRCLKLLVLIHSGSTPLHLAARGGSLDCVHTLLAWGADLLQRDSSGRIPYSVAIKHNHGACATLLNPSAAEPLVWPSPLKFISELDPDARALLEVALMDANKESEKIILNERKKLLSPANVDKAFHDDASEGLVKQFAQGHNSSIYWLSKPIMISLLQLNSADLIAKGNLYTRSCEDAASKLLEKALKIQLGRGF